VFKLTGAANSHTLCIVLPLITVLMKFVSRNLCSCRATFYLQWAGGSGIAPHLPVHFRILNDVHGDMRDVL
jgi:hypothetical protein